MAAPDPVLVPAAHPVVGAAAAVVAGLEEPVRTRPQQDDDDGRCRHDMLPGQCAEASCRPDGQTLELAAGPGGLLPDPVPVVTRFEAQFSGECSNCGAWFEAGATIGVHVVSQDGRCGRGKYVCGRCCA